MTHLQRRSSSSCSLDLQLAGGEENRRPCSRREEEAASSKQQAAGKIHRWAAWIGTGRKGGGSEMHAIGKRWSSAAHTAGVRSTED